MKAESPAVVRDDTASRNLEAKVEGKDVVIIMGDET